MQLLHRCAGCGAVILAIVWSGWAAEPQKAPMSASGAKPTDVTGPAPVVMSPGSGGPNAAGRPSPFSPEVTAEFMKKVQETSAKIEAAKRQIAERRAQLYTTNPEIKSTYALMIEGQKEINRILDADRELAELKMNRDILGSTMPAQPPSPKGTNPAFGQDAPKFGPTLAAVDQLNPERVRQNMQLRSEYDELNRRITDRQTTLYEENARIKEIQTQLLNLQTKIDKWLDQDEELTALKNKLKAVAPEFPLGMRKGVPTNAPPCSTNRQSK